MYVGQRRVVLAGCSKDVKAGVVRGVPVTEPQEFGPKGMGTDRE